MGAGGGLEGAGWGRDGGGRGMGGRGGGMYRPENQQMLVSYSDERIYSCFNL